MSARREAIHCRNSVARAIGWPSQKYSRRCFDTAKPVMLVGMDLRRLSFVIVCLTGPATGTSTATETVDYVRQIKPILRQRCFACHGALKQNAELRLDTVALMIRGGESGPVISPGDPAKSTLVERITASDMDERMPPEHEGEPLTEEQVRLIRNWIAQGAVAPHDEQQDADPSDHWAFRPVVRPQLPTSDGSWGYNSMDSFLQHQHRRFGLIPQNEAPRIILLRRLYFDLIGVPPTAQEIESFVNDQAPDWYEQTVDRLLDDPRHGERWARHWMDIWRYSDWWGLGQQLRRSQKHIWHWRDWIVESLNSDTPYDEMVRLMLAADELYPNDLEKLRATGFLARNYWLFNRNQWMEETVEHVSKGLLGLTMNCAKCHDHKYDPIEQTDFYRMRAFFEPYHVRLEVLSGEPDLQWDGIPRVFDRSLDAPTYRFERGQENQPDQTTIITPGTPEFITFRELDVQPVQLPAEAWQPARRPWVIADQLSAAARSVRDAASKLQRLHDEPEASRRPEQALEVQAAQTAVAAAEAELVRAQRCADAMQAGWELEDQAAGDSSLPEETLVKKTASAVRAERDAVVARRRHEVTVAELDLFRATDEKKEAAENHLTSARESLDKAVAIAATEITATDSYTRFQGAKWTATRFLFSGRDDPPAAFAPRSTGRRTALVRWITDRRNPLTARVAANHIWMRHMGRPVVPTVFDFGRNGGRPTNSDLLDWLAAELMDGNWSMKHLHRTIVTSAAYRMSSSSSDGEMNATTDPDNVHWWRRVPIRLESQLVRDSILSHAGTLDGAMGGPSVLRPQQANSTRRSLYFFHSNNDRNLLLKTFDEARVTECYRREQSIVPQQALALTNSGLVLDASVQIAQRLFNESGDESAFVRTAFAMLLGIEAGDEEFAAATLALTDWRQLPDGSERNARSQFIWALINHNDFVTLR